METASPEGNPHEVKNTFDNLTLFGVDSYDATTYMARLSRP